MRVHSSLAASTIASLGVVLLAASSPSISGQITVTDKPGTAVTASRCPWWQRHPVPCGWSAILDARHPERPRTLILNTDSHSCAPEVKGRLIVSAASSLSMIYRSENASISINVTALEAGAAGDVIRCRSLMDGSVIPGRILDSRSVEMLSRERKTTW